jgi:hypothetical protein
MCSPSRWRSSKAPWSRAACLFWYPAPPRAVLRRQGHDASRNANSLRPLHDNCNLIPEIGNDRVTYTRQGLPVSNRWGRPMPLAPLRDPDRPPRDRDRATRFVVRAVSWVVASLVEGFASCAVTMHPELTWLTDEHDDQTRAPFSGTIYANVASRQTVTGAPMASPTAVRTEGRDGDD